MTSGRPMDLNRGSWFAKHGGARLRFGAVPGGPNVSSHGPTSGERKGKVPAPAKHFPASDVSDALDDLLLHARATLKQLDAMRARQASKSRAEPTSNTAGKGRPATMRGLGGVRPQFWRPSCQAHLWTGVAHDFDGLFDSDDDLESTESEGSVDWDLLHGASKAPGRPGHFRSPAADAARAASAAKAAPLPKRGFSVPPPPPPRPAPKAEAKAQGPSGASVPGAKSNTSQPNQGGQQKSQGPHRGHAAGFRFGAAKVPTLAGPEVEVRATLEAAKTSGGSDAGRQALKRLLLRWHPDKAPQGETPEAKAAQAEATRVLRFILQERERLGL